MAELELATDGPVAEPGTTISARGSPVALVFEEALFPVSDGVEEADPAEFLNSMALPMGNDGLDSRGVNSYSA